MEHSDGNENNLAQCCLILGKCHRLCRDNLKVPGISPSLDDLQFGGNIRDFVSPTEPIEVVWPVEYRDTMGEFQETSTGINSHFKRFGFKAWTATIIHAALVFEVAQYRNRGYQRATQPVKLESAQNQSNRFSISRRAASRRPPWEPPATCPPAARQSPWRATCEGAPRCRGCSRRGRTVRSPCRRG